MPEGVAVALISSGVVLVALFTTILFLRDRLRSFELGPNGFKATLGKVVEAQEKQSKEMQLIAELTRLLVSQDQRNHLRNLQSGKWETKIHRALILELSYLLALRFVERQEGHGIRSLEDKERNGEASDDVCSHLRITDRGRKYLAMADEMDRARLGDVSP